MLLAEGLYFVLKLSKLFQLLFSCIALPSKVCIIVFELTVFILELFVFFNQVSKLQRLHFTFALLPYFYILFLLFQRFLFLLALGFFLLFQRFLFLLFFGFFLLAFFFFLLFVRFGEGYWAYVIGE